MTLQMMMDHEYEDGFAKGSLDGARKNAEQNAINFLKMKLGSFEQIAQGTGLSISRIQELAQSIKQ